MSFLKRLLSNGRVRSASRRLSEDPSPKGYAELAQEHAVHGELDEALSVAEEGLKAHPQDTELKRVHERIRQLSLEGRTRELSQQLKTAPRPAVWAELCQILVESGRVARAEDLAIEWYQSSKHPDAQYWRARARAERFFADKRRDDGRLAFDLIAAAEEVLPSDPRPHKLRLQLASRAGAWVEARRALARLLELQPGEPALEARFRTVAALAEKGRTVDQALREVEKTGRLVDEDPTDTKQPIAGDVRPLLQNVARENGVRGVFYVRGATALVQGPKGPTADRMARGVREVVASCRTAARRLGLGQAGEVTLEGDFGTLHIKPEECASAAVWCAGEVSRRIDDGLRDVLARGASHTEAQA
jgi:tetratricopeptide (TPR) repeat protein